MKKHTTLMSIALSAGCFSNLACGADWSDKTYVGARAGPAYANVNSDKAALEVNLAGGHSIAIDVDRHDFSGTAYGGYWLNDLFAVEVGLSYLGEFDTTVTGTSPNTSRLAQDVKEHLPATGGSAVSLALRQKLAVTDSLDIVPRLGVFYANSERDVTAGGESIRSKSSTGGALFGLALDHAISRNVHFGGGLTGFAGGGRAAQYELSFSLEYNFKSKNQ